MTWLLLEVIAVATKRRIAMSSIQHPDWNALGDQELLKYLKDLATRLRVPPGWRDINAASEQGDFPPLEVFRARWRSIYHALWRADLPTEKHLRAIASMRRFSEEESGGWMPTVANVIELSGEHTYLSLIHI